MQLKSINNISLKHVREGDVQPFVVNYFENKGWKIKECVSWNELSNITKKEYNGKNYGDIDIVGIAENPRRILICEVKSRFMSAVYKQAYKRSKYADFIFVAFAEQLYRTLGRLEFYYNMYKTWGIETLILMDDKIHKITGCDIDTNYFKEEFKKKLEHTPKWLRDLWGFPSEESIDKMLCG